MAFWSSSTSPEAPSEGHMKEIRTEIAINASAERVWTVLTDFASFPQWSPFIAAAEGELTPGSALYRPE